MKTLFFIASLCATHAWGAELAVPSTITFTNKYGVVISEAPVIKVTADRVIYKLPSGGGSVMITNLPASLQLDFGYDAVAVDNKKEEALLLRKQQALLRAKIEVERKKEMDLMIVRGKEYRKQDLVKFYAEVSRVFEDGFSASLYDSLSKNRTPLEGRYGWVFIYAQAPFLEGVRSRDKMEGYMLHKGTRIVEMNKVIEPQKREAFVLADPYLSPVLPTLLEDLRVMISDRKVAAE